MRMPLQLSESDFEVVIWVDIKHRAADVLSRLRRTGIDDLPLEDDIPFLSITKAQPESGNNETNMRMWPRLLIMMVVWTP